MKKRGAAAALLALSWGAGCSHLPSTKPSGANEDRYRSQSQVVELADCAKLDGLRRFERGLFKGGFLREVVREEAPVAYEFVERLVSGDARLVAFRRSDFTRIKTRGSEPYEEVVNRYLMTPCEEPAGGLFLIIVRHNPDPEDKFLGTRMTAALASSGCQIHAVAPPRDLGFYASTTEDDLLRHVRRGLCHAYAEGK